MFYFLHSMMQQPVTKNKYNKCMVSNTDFFTPTLVEANIENEHYKEIYPITSLDNARHAEFSVENNTDKLMDLEIDT